MAMTFRWMLVPALAIAVMACGSEVTVRSPEAQRLDATVASETEMGATTPPTAPIVSEPVSDGLPFGLASCGPFGVLAADESVYREQPVYIANEMPVDEVRNWAVGQPGFADIWIDREHNGWIGVGFTSDVAARQADLEREFPAVGVAAVPIEFTMAELTALQAEVFAVMAANGVGQSGGISVPSGRVSVFVGVLDAETLEPFAPFADRPVCFEGVDPADAVQDGPQPTAGDGWRLLAAERTGFSYRTGVATSDAQYERLWARSGVGTERPIVDFDGEIVVWFGAVYGSGCEIRMDDVVIDRERAVVHGDFVIPGNPGECNADANPEAYVVAVERSVLPTGPFSVQLSESDPPPGAPGERTVVDVDLSAPGSAAPDEAIHEDADLGAQAADPSLVAGDFVEPGFPQRYVLDMACEFDVVGPFNDVMWQAVNDGISQNPHPAWSTMADAGGSLATELELGVDPPVLTLSANGHVEIYEPSDRDATTDCP